MVQAWYGKGVFLYLMAGVCGVGILFKVILGWYLGRMVRNTEKMQKTRKKWLKKMQQDYQTCAKECGRVHNVDIFVDKYVGNRRFLGIMLSTWDKFGGQTALICAGIAVVAAAAGVFYQVDREAVLFTFFVGIWLVIINMVVDNMASLPEKREQAATNLKDYFINWMAGPEAAAEDQMPAPIGQDAASTAMPELALAEVTENELEALLGCPADGREPEAEMPEEEEGQKTQARLYVINNERESVQKAKTKQEQPDLPPDGQKERKAASAQKESRKEASVRKKREKMIRQATAVQEKEKAEEEENISSQEEQALAGQQVAAARQEEVPPSREEAMEDAEGSKNQGNGQLIEEVLREFLV